MHWIVRYFLFSFIPWTILATGNVVTQAEKSSIFNVCYNSSLEGFRLNGAILKDIIVSQWIDCVMECAFDVCCRSINFKKKTSSGNELNCEMLYDVVYNTSEKLLETNFSYDYAYLVNPQKTYNISCLPQFLQNNLPECREPAKLGMESGLINDSQISASSKWDKLHSAQNGRLNFHKPGQKHAWVSEKGQHNNSWLQVDFKNLTLITEVLTQGRGDLPQWVTNFTLSYYNESGQFQQYAKNGKEKVFPGNTDQNTTIHHKLLPVVITEKIKIHPKSWHVHPALRVDFIGCSQVGT